MQRPIMESEVHIMLRDTQPSQSVAINVHSNKSIELERQITANQLLGGTTISFMNLSYNISGQESKSILKDVSGFFPCGKLSAILGSSGAGKTSLLNLVACRLEKNNKNQVCGQRFVNGYIYDYEKFNNFAAYVMQNDILLESQTPREAITFVAQLKYRDELTVNQKVSDTLKLLQLNTCQNTFIGGLFRKGLSGGEKKRLSIAIELVSDPHCLILDEPTSGLDSYTAFHIIHELKKLALNNNKTIILTIHQPSNDIYNEIDHLIVMSYGSFIFQGSREDAEFYFNKINLKCPQRTNPPDHFIQLTHSQIAQNYLLEQYQNYIQPQINKIINQQSRNNYYVKQNETSSGRKILVLFKRNYQNYVRNVFLLATRVLITFFLSLSFGYIYWKIGENNGMPQESFYLVGSIFFLTTTVMFSNALGILLVFDQEREVFIREEASKLYGIMVYFVSKQFLELPDNIILTLIQCSIAYWMMGYNDVEWWMFFQTCAIFTTLAMCGNSIGIMCGCVMKQKALALSVTPFILIPFIMYGGYLANQDNYYPWIGWIQYINPLKYAFEGELTNETYNRFYLVDPLQKYNLSLGVWQCIGLNFLCFLLYRILALILLYRLRHKLQ